MSSTNDKPRIITASGFRQNYSLPEIYDIAFSFPDFPAETDFLLRVASDHLGRPVQSVIEMACGPAAHMRETARRGIAADGLDLSPEMVAFARTLVSSENLPSHIFEGDMRSFRGERKYDLAFCLMASFAQLLTNQDILDHFHCVADLLNDDGIFIIATAHPRDFYGDEPTSVSTSWTMTRGDLTVETNWGGDNQQFDPLTEVDDIIVSYLVTTPSGTTRYEFPDKYRRCSLQTFQALIDLSGRFKVVASYGGFDHDLPLSNHPTCWRFIPVLQKIK